MPVEIFARSDFFVTAIRTDANDMYVTTTLTPAPDSAFLLGLVATGFFTTIRLRLLFFSV